MTRVIVLMIINVLPVLQWLLLYNWFGELKVIVKLNGFYSKYFCVIRGTRQGSIIEQYLFNIFNNKLLLDVNDCGAGFKIGDTLFNCVA